MTRFKTSQEDIPWVHPILFSRLCWCVGKTGFVNFPDIFEINMCVKIFLWWIFITCPWIKSTEKIYWIKNTQQLFKSLPLLKLLAIGESWIDHSLLNYYFTSLNQNWINWSGSRIKSVRIVKFQCSCCAGCEVVAKCSC